MRIAHAVLVALALVSCGHAAVPPAAAKTAETAPDKIAAAVRGAIEQWRQAYEVRSIEGLSKLYARDDSELVVVLEGVPMIGWASINADLADRINRAKQIHIRIKNVEVASPVPGIAIAIATMTREVSDGITAVTENGTVTLVFREADTGWLIVAEHYSYKRQQ